MTTKIHQAVTEIANIPLARRASEGQTQERSDRDAGSEEWLRYDSGSSRTMTVRVDKY